MFRGVFVPASIGVIGPSLFLKTSYVLAEVMRWRGTYDDASVRPQVGFLLTMAMALFTLLIIMFTIHGLSGATSTQCTKSVVDTAVQQSSRTGAFKGAGRTFSSRARLVCT